MKLEQLQQAFQAQVLRGQAGIEGEIVGDERTAVAAPARRVWRGVSGAADRGPGRDLSGAAPGRWVPRASGAASVTSSAGIPAGSVPARDYGAELSDWLAADRGPRAQGVADLARFEWAMAAAFDAADAVALLPGRLSGIAPEEWAALQFSFSPDTAASARDEQCRSVVEVRPMPHRRGPAAGDRPVPSTGSSGARNWRCTTGAWRRPKRRRWMRPVPGS